ncbi:MAG: 7TM diverse intracellular signaling domain-containing protein [Sulfurimonas sp.]
MNNQLVQALFFGGMLVVFIYNFILYLFSKNSIYLYYVGMVFVLTLHHLSLRGMISYLLPNNNEIVMIQTAMPVYYTSMAVIGVILFVRKFLNLYRYRKIDFLLKFYMFLVVLIMLFSSKEFYLLNLVAHMTILMSISLEVIGVYLFITKKEKYAKYFVIVWTITFSGFILTALYHAGLVNLPSSHIFELTLITEALLFSIILANQINDLKNEKLKLSVSLLEQEKKEHQKDKIIQEQTKLASMGQMLGEIAHQWKQPLSEINSVVLDLETDFHQKKLTHDSLNNNLTQIEAVTEYMSQTIEDFNSYYKDSDDKGTVSCEEIVKKALSLLESSLKANSITVTTQILDKTKLDGYSSKLTQALIIIITNAKDALLEQNIDNKIIEIIVAKEGNKHIITIEDNAGGIKEDNIQKIFEPYFSTKFKSKGVGIGLYIAKKLIEDDGVGHLTVVNKLMGARFKISL